MPFELIEEPEHDLMITAPYGQIADGELLAYYTGRIEDGTLGSGRDELVDGRWIHHFDVSAEGQAALVELLEDHRDRLDGMRWGFIADSMVSFGMFRMFEGQKRDLPFETSVFRTPHAAAEWLGVPVDAVLTDPPGGV